MKKTVKAKKTTRKSVRLAAHVAPIHYKILLHPDLEAHTFSGEETITISLSKPAKEITLHSVGLMITEGKIAIGKQAQLADRITYDEKAETATFHFKRVIPKGKAKLSCSFSGILADNMRGFYKSKYQIDGKDRFMATTQFEATDARRAIPCFDEPAHKAVFEISLAVAPDKTAISNTMPTSIVEHESGVKIVSFAPTPKMSTYLLAFIVGDFEYLEGKTKRGVQVRVFTIPGKKAQARFALDCATRVIDFYEEYFAIQYPLPVLDMIAIPDFTSAAMENWGAVTYRESALLVDEATTSASTRQWVAIVVAHELAHQWFGNLVTMEWWTHLWLNEGFATYLEHVAVDHLFPEYNAWSQFVIGSTGHGLSQALRLDSLASTHPVEVDVHHPDEIGEIFDEVSYAKGASVIRMLAEYIGEKHFRSGLREYLKTHSYKNTETTDLWSSFEKASKLPVKKMMQNWIRMAGYPLVSIEDRGKKFAVSQKRFFLSPLAEKKNTGTELWSVPIVMQSKEGITKPFLLAKSSSNMLKTTEGWVKLNPGESGVFRVAYDKTMLDLLREPIANKTLAAPDRLGIIRDLFTLAQAGKGSIVAALDMLSAYRDEDAFIVWNQILSGLASVNHIFADAPFAAKLKAYSLSIVEAQAARMGWEKLPNEPHEMTFLRSSVLYAAGHYGHKGIIKKARQLFAERAKTPLHPDLKGAVYSLVAEYGGEKEWKELVGMHRASPQHEEKNRIERILSSFPSKKLLARTLAFGMSQEVRSQDLPFLLASAIATPSATLPAWQFTQKHWNEFIKRYGKGGHLLSYVVNPLASFSEKKYALEIQAFFKKNPAPGATRTIEQVIEKILLNDAWKKRDAKKVENWLKTNT